MARAEGTKVGAKEEAAVQTTAARGPKAKAGDRDGPRAATTDKHGEIKEVNNQCIKAHGLRRLVAKVGNNNDEMMRRRPSEGQLAIRRAKKVNSREKVLRPTLQLLNSKWEKDLGKEVGILTLDCVVRCTFRPVLVP